MAMANQPAETLVKLPKDKRLKAEQVMKSVENAMAQKENEIALAAPDESRLKAAQKRLEDALATQATGGKVSGLPALRSEWEAAKAEFEADAASAKARRDEAETALAGLRRRLESLQSDYGAIQHEYLAAVQKVLEGERDAYFSRYLKAADEIAVCYSELMALARIAGRRNFNIGALWRSVGVPALPAPHCDVAPPGHRSGDPATCFTPVSLAGLIDEAEPTIAARLADIWE